MIRFYLISLSLFLMAGFAHAQWQPLHGPVGGNIEALENFNGLQYCGTVTGGLFHRQGNQQWKLLHEFNDAVYAVFRKDNYLWIGTQSSTWLLLLDESNEVDQAILVNEDLSTWNFTYKEDNLYLATNAGVLKSKYNDITTLNNISTGLPPEGLMATSITFFGEDLYATVQGFKLENDVYTGLSGIYRSSDYGVTWEADTIIDNDSRALYVDGSLLLAGTHSGLFYKDQSATEWTLSADVGEYNGVIDIEKFNNKFYVTTFSGVFVSTDGTSWSQLQTSSLPDFVLYFDDYNNKLSCGAYGVNESDDGSTWSAVNAGLLASTTNAILNTGNDLLVATETNGNFLWKNGTWTEANGGMSPTSMVRGLTQDGNILYACTGAGAYKSEDHGNTWTSIQGDLSEDFFITQIAVADHRLYGLNPLFGIVVSDDGEAWTEVNDGLTTGRGGYEVYSIYSDGTDVYVGTGYGIFRLDKQNSIWIDLSTGALPPGPKYSILKDGSNLIVTTSAGIAYTTDYGANWADLSLDGIAGVYMVGHNLLKGEDGGYYMVCMTYDEAEDKILQKVYRSESGAISWEAFDINMPSTTPTALSQKGDYLYMGTAGKGVYRHGIFGVIAGTQEEHQYQLKQNHPNPASTSTVIEYTAPRNHRVVVMDSRGNVVASKTGSSSDLKTYRLTLDTSKYPTGIYFYYLESPAGKSETKKISVIR